MKKKKENSRKIIIISVICVIVIGIACFFIFDKFIQKDFRKNPQVFENNFPEDNSRGGRNFQPINETTKNEITSFFESSSSSFEIENYCDKNPMYCMYYCMEINTNHGICEELTDKFQVPEEEPIQ